MKSTEPKGDTGAFVEKEGSNDLEQINEEFKIAFERLFEGRTDNPLEHEDWLRIARDLNAEGQFAHAYAMPATFGDYLENDEWPRGGLSVIDKNKLAIFAVQDMTGFYLKEGSNKRRYSLNFNFMLGDDENFNLAGIDKNNFTVSINGKDYQVSIDDAILVEWENGQLKILGITRGNHLDVESKDSVEETYGSIEIKQPKINQPTEQVQNEPQNIASDTKDAVQSLKETDDEGFIEEMNGNIPKILEQLAEKQAERLKDKLAQRQGDQWLKPKDWEDMQKHLAGEGQRVRLC
ncbi:hypothetical protein ACFLZH_04115, partial [Patescibacteria group bacterium]